MLLFTTELSICPDECHHFVSFFAEAFGSTWAKQYCRYKKDTKEFEMIPFNPITSKTVVRNIFPTNQLRIRKIPLSNGS